MQLLRLNPRWWWRNGRLRLAREFDVAVGRHVSVAVEGAVADAMRARGRAEERAAWIAEQKAKYREDLSDPRVLARRRLQVAALEPDAEKRFAIGGGALAQYLDDSEMTELWRALA